jgi:hypothetical protein
MILKTKGACDVNEILKDYIGKIRIGGQQAFRNLAMFPITSEEVIPFDYLTLDEALAKDLIEVVEIDDEGAVPELRVVNRSDRMVLILDGEELVGAKQNRIVNTTILVPGKETVVIPVSCVEQGRWGYASERFTSEKRLAPFRLRALKATSVHCSMKASGSFSSDQLEIWDDISARATRRRAKSDSLAMCEIYKKDRSSLNEYLEHFATVASQVGAVFVIDGRVVGLECFGKPETFRKAFEKLLESYAMDAIDPLKPGEGRKASSKAQVSEFIDSAAASRVEPYPAVGAGTDLRLDSKKCTGFALSHEEGVLHLSVFARDDGGKSRRPPRRR